jgi:hypothetical protein
MSDLEQLWNMMKETNAGVMKIVLDAHGIERSRAMILIDGVDEVNEIVSAVEKIEDSWES